MITIYKKTNVYNAENDKKEIELRGLSTDTKPLTVEGKDVPNGSVFIEINTGKIFLFDLDNKTWNEVS